MLPRDPGNPMVWTMKCKSGMTSELSAQELAYDARQGNPSLSQVAVQWQCLVYNLFILNFNFSVAALHVFIKEAFKKISKSQKSKGKKLR